MGRGYAQLTLEERAALFRLHAARNLAAAHGGLYGKLDRGTQLGEAESVAGLGQPPELARLESPVSAFSRCRHTDPAHGVDQAVKAQLGRGVAVGLGDDL